MVVTDFDGNPLQDPHDRSRSQSPLRDVASMVQSIEHVGAVVVKRRRPDRADDVARFTVAATRAAVDSYSATHDIADGLMLAFRVAQELHEYAYSIQSPAALAIRRRRCTARPARGQLVDPAAFLADLEAKPATCWRCSTICHVARRSMLRSDRADRHGLVVVRRRCRRSAHYGATASQPSRSSHQSRPPFRHRRISRSSASPRRARAPRPLGCWRHITVSAARSRLTNDSSARCRRNTWC